MGFHVKAIMIFAYLFLGQDAGAAVGAALRLVGTALAARPLLGALRTLVLAEASLATLVRRRQRRLLLTRR